MINAGPYHNQEPSTRTSKEAPVGLQIEVIISGAHNFLVYNQAGRTIATLISISAVLWKETNMVSFRNDDERKFGRRPS